MPETNTSQVMGQWESVKKNFAESILKMFPIQGRKNVLEMHDITFDESKAHPSDIRAQELAKHQEKTWGIPVYAKFVLKDKVTGQTLNESKQKLAVMPRLTPRDTYIVSGGEWNSAYQWRLKSGIYSKIAENGKLETEFNLNGAGKDFARESRLKIPFDPEKKKFNFKYGTISIPLYSMLKADDMSDEDIKKEWGEDIFNANFKKNWQQDIMKLYNSKLKKRGIVPESDSFEHVKIAVQKELHKAEVLPETTKLTLGKEVQNLSGKALLDGSMHILGVSQGKKSDDVYSLYFKHLLGLDDFIAEKFGASKTAQAIKAKIRNTIDKREKVAQIIPNDLFSKPLSQVFIGNTLSQRPDQTNPIDILSSSSITTIKGPGGISSDHSIRNPMKVISQSHFSMLDPILSPEGSETGVTLHLPIGTRKVGREARTLAYDLLHKKFDYINASQLHGDYTVLPDQIKWKGGSPDAISKVKAKDSTYQLGTPSAKSSYVTALDPITHEFVEIPFEKARYVLPSPRNLFSEATNLIPFLQNNQGNRTMTGAKQPSQGVPLKYREAPLVQVQSNDPSTTFEQTFGKRFSHQSPTDGTVTNIIKDKLGNTDEIHIEDAAGKTHKVQIYNNFPLNDKKSFLHADPIVQVGQKVAKREQIADTNFSKDGTLAVGTNLKVAYMPYGAFSVSGDSMVYWIDKDGRGHYTPIRDVPSSKGIKSNILDCKTLKPKLHVLHSFIGHYTDDKMMEVRTNKGTIVKATKEHSFISLNEYGDFINIKPTEMIPGKTLLPLIQPIIDFGSEPGPIDLVPQTKAGREVKLTLNWDTGFLFGMFVAEGCVIKKGDNFGGISIAVVEPELVNKLLEILQSLGLNPKHNLYERPNGISGVITMSSAALATYLHENCGRYANGKRIPDILWSAPKEFAEGFISGYWSGDGTCTKEVTASTGSKELADGICFLLAALGVRAHARSYKTIGQDSWLIRVEKDYISKMPSIFLKRKEERKNAIANSNTAFSHDIVPIPEKLKVETLQALEKRSLKSDCFYASRPILKKNYEKLPITIKQLVDAPVWWEVVESVKEIEYEEYVYDLDMRPYGNFIVGAGLVVHNTFEDGVVVSESGAKKLTSEHLHKTALELDPKNDKVSLSKFISHISTVGKRIKKDKLANLDENGIIKPGSIVKPGDLLVTAISKNTLEGQLGSMTSKLKGAYSAYKDKSLVWDHDYEGHVIKVVPKPGEKGYTVYVKTQEPAKIGDKICYDEETEILTKGGWKFIKDVTLEDEICTLNRANDEIEYHQSTELHYYPTGDNMYKIESQQVDLFVTQDHNMYVKSRDKKEFSLIPAKEIYKKRVQYKKDGNWAGKSPEYISFPPLEVKAGQSGHGVRIMPEMKMPVKTFMMLLGAFLSEGNLLNQSKNGDYGIEICQVKEPNRQLFIDELFKHGIKFVESGDKLRIHSKQLMLYFKQFGKSYQKYIPNEIFGYSKEDLEILFRWLMWGDGTTLFSGRPVCYTTTSIRLANDVQRLCLHIGKAGNVFLRKEACKQTIMGRTYDCRDCYEVRIVNTKLTPEVNHGHVHTQKIQKEKLISNYKKPVYCLTVKNHVVYVRRNGKAVWSGNCGRHGDKNIIGAIIPDHQMPHIVGEKEPFDLITAPSGVVSRINLGQLLELGASKIAKKTGKPYIVSNFAPGVDYQEKLGKDMKQHEVVDKDKVFDPLLGKELEGSVLTGHKFIIKQKHQVEKKESVRGLDQALAGKYSVNFDPQRGKGEGAQAISPLDVYALLAHGARANLKEMSSYKAELQHDANTGMLTDSDFWNRVMLGIPLQPPKATFAYRKLEGYLTGLGLNLKKDGHSTILTPLTDKGVLSISNGEIKEADQTRGKDDKEIPGGLFDPKITGGLPNQPGKGRNWGHISLAEPFPNPLYVGSVHLPGPAPVLSGLSFANFDKIVKGQMTVPINGKEMTGGKAIAELLKKIDVKKEFEEIKKQLPTLKGSELNKANKKAKFLQALDKLNMRPEEAYIMNHIPVLPPMFRPITVLPDGSSTSADINTLYKSLILLNNGLKEKDVLKNFPEKEQKLREDVYDALKATTGLGKVPSYKGNKALKGILQTVAGDSPKTGFFQSKIMKRRQELSMRSTIIPGPDMNIDEVGLPKNAAMELYAPFVIRHLVRSGKDLLEAKKEYKEGTALAWRALENAIKDRPVLVKRDPVLHKYNVMAYHPKLIEGNAISMHPLNCALGNADFDGDSCLGEILIVKYSNNSWNNGTKENNMPHLNCPVRTIFNVIDISQFPHLPNTGVSKGKNIEFDVPEGIFVPSFLPTGMKILPVTKYSIHPNCEEWITKTLLEREIISSSDHSLAVLDPITLEVVKTEPRNAIGKCIPTLRGITQSAICNHITGESSNENYLVVTKDMLKEVPLTYDVGWFIGATIGDGWVRHSRGKAGGVDFASGTQTPEVKEKWKRGVKLLCPEVTLLDRIMPHDFEGTPCVSVKTTSNSSALARWVERLIGSGAVNKHLPPNFIGMPDEFRKGLFCGLIDTDGSCNWNVNNRFNLTFHTISPGLTDEVCVLALSLGLIPSITQYENRNKPAYAINFSVRTVQDAKWLKFECIYKQEALSRLHNLELKDYGPSDIVPFTPAAKIEIMKALVKLGANRSGELKNKSAYSMTVVVRRNNGFITRTSAEKIYALITQAQLDISEHLQRWFSLVMNTTIGWDFITEAAATGQIKTMYDITVPDSWTFTMANGAVIWDTMAVHLPLTEQARQEAIDKMLPSKNLFSATNYGIMHAPDQESIIGLNNLSHWGAKKEKTYKSLEDLVKSDSHLNDVVNVKVDGHVKETTKGRALLVQNAPQDMDHSKLLHDPSFTLKKSSIHKMLETFAKKDPKGYPILVDDWRRKGNDRAHEMGFSFSLSDLKPLKEKRDAILAPYHQKAAQIRNSGDDKDKQDEKIVHLYNEATVELDDKLGKEYGAMGNNMHKMVDTKARGSMAQFRQTVIAPMLLVDANNRTIPTPVTNSYAEGLNVAQYWTTLHGARKGTLQRAQSTALPGAMAKEIINLNIASPVVKHDCGTDHGLSMSLHDVKGHEEHDVMDRYLSKDQHGLTKGTLVTPEIFSKLNKEGIKQIEVRSPITCAVPQGICAKCFGINENGRDHEIGTNIGVIASQALSEPAVQLAMDSLVPDCTLTILRNNKQENLTIKDLYDSSSEEEFSIGPVLTKLTDNLYVKDIDKNGNTNFVKVFTIQKYPLDSFTVKVATTTTSLECKESHPFWARKENGEWEIIKAEDLEGWFVYVGDKENRLEKVVSVEETNYQGLVYDLSTETQSFVANSIKTHNSFHSGGTALSRGGGSASRLDRLGQLLNIPKTLPYSATLSKVDGKVHSIEKDSTGGHDIFIKREKEMHKHYVPSSLDLKVEVGHEVQKGDAISTGPINPHQLLQLKDMNAVRKYLTNEMGNMYKDVGGVRRRNVEVVVRNLTNLTEVVDSGKSDHLAGDILPTSIVEAHNRAAKDKDDKILHRPILRGIKESALLKSEDYLSRMNFQRIQNTLIEGAGKMWHTTPRSLDPIPAWSNSSIDIQKDKNDAKY